MVSNTIAQLEKHVQSVPVKWNELRPSEVVEPRLPGKWSRLQILGHLCDSAINNLTRFIQSQHRPEPLTLVPYDQDVWVALQGYSEKSSDEVLMLWVSLNRSIVRVMAEIPKESHNYTCILPDGGRVTLERLMDDYLQHMEHHLQQIFPE